MPLTLVTGGTPASRASHLALLLDGLPQQALTAAALARGAVSAPAPVPPSTDPSLAVASDAGVPADTAASPGSIAVILEGLAVSGTALDENPAVRVHRIAPGCLCCTGNLVLRVTLNRILRFSPAQVFIALADVGHVDQLRSWLRQPPYDQLLFLTPDEALEKHPGSPTSEAWISGKSDRAKER